MGVYWKKEFVKVCKMLMLKRVVNLCEPNTSFALLKIFFSFCYQYLKYIGRQLHTIILEQNKILELLPLDA